MGEKKERRRIEIEKQERVEMKEEGVVLDLWFLCMLFSFELALTRVKVHY